MEVGSLRPFVISEEIVKILEAFGIKCHKFQIRAIDLVCMIYIVVRLVEESGVWMRQAKGESCGMDWVALVLGRLTGVVAEIRAFPTP